MWMSDPQYQDESSAEVELHTEVLPTMEDFLPVSPVLTVARLPASSTPVGGREGENEIDRKRERERERERETERQRERQRQRQREKKKKKETFIHAFIEFRNRIA